MERRNIIHVYIISRDKEQGPVIKSSIWFLTLFAVYAYLLKDPNGQDSTGEIAGKVRNKAADESVVPTGGCQRVRLRGASRDLASRNRQQGCPIIANTQGRLSS